MVEIGLHLPLPTFSDCIPCRGHSARKSTMFGHRCTFVWPPPVRLFALPTNVREASCQHPACYVDAYAHTHAHADQLWGVQYENAVPLFISVLMRTSSNASHTPHTHKSTMSADGLPAPHHLLPPAPHHLPPPAQHQCFWPTVI